MGIKGIEFRATTEARGKGLRVRLPFDPNERWGVRDRHDITGTVHGFTVRGPIRHSEAGWHLDLGPAWVRDCPVPIGQEVAVSIAPEGPQVDSMAPDIAQGLEAAHGARAFFEGLPTFYRKNYMRWIESAKRPETRARRIAEAAELLSKGIRDR